MDEATQKIVDRIEKLSRLASKNPNAEEAASAAAKVQQLLLEHNLSMSVVEAASGQSSKRERANVSGGGYKYQQRLWRHIAELNMCLYWTQKVPVRPGSYAERRHRTFTAEHKLVGRVLNVQQTRNMASYLHQTIERLRREAMGSDTRSREAMAFREGVADAVIEKLVERRRDAVDKEKRELAEAARRAAASGVSLATTLTISTLKQRETDENLDHLYGAGYSARRRAEAAADKQRLAKEEAAEERAWAKWCEENPEEARKLAREQEARERAKERRRARSGGGYGRYRFRETAEEMRQGSNIYHRGFEAGKKVSIDPQAEDHTQRKIGSK
jgi:hypothetical protein